MKFSGNVFLLAFLVCGLFGCSTVSVSTDFDPATDFSKFSTYALGKRPNPNDALASNQLIQDRVYAAINDTMQARGFQRVTDNPQLTIYPHAVTEQKTRMYTDPGTMGYGYGRWGRRGAYGWGGAGNVQVDNYTEGALIIDIVNTSTNKLVWRGVGKAALSDPSTPEKRTEKIDQAVAEILAKFPPVNK